MSKKVFAEIVSSVFHPVIFFIIMPFFIVYRHTQNSESALKWEIFSLAFVIIAIVVMFVGRIKGYFSDFDLTKRAERYKFYTILLFFAVVYIVIAFYLRGMFFPMSLIALGIAIGIGVFDFFNKFIKASDHAAVSCGFVITIGLLYGPTTFILLFWIVPLVCWSRLILKRHTFSELLAGSILGSLITLSTFFVGKSL